MKGFLFLLKGLLCYIFHFLLYREQWPQEFVCSSLGSMRVREAYLARRTTLLQFKFVDPMVSYFYTAAKPYDNLLLDKNDVFFSQVLFQFLVMFLFGLISV